MSALDQVFIKAYSAEVAVAVVPPEQERDDTGSDGELAPQPAPPDATPLAVGQLCTFGGRVYRVEPAHPTDQADRGGRSLPGLKLVQLSKPARAEHSQPEASPEDPPVQESPSPAAAPSIQPLENDLTIPVSAEPHNTSVPPGPHFDVSRMARPIETSPDGVSAVEALLGEGATLAKPEPDAVPILSTPSTSPPKSEFRPQWEVSFFRRPEICERLVEEAPGWFKGVAQRLCAAAAHGQRVVAVAGCSRGVGSTTLAIALAGELAAAGARVVLVDADSDNPELASRLGVNARAGWESASGDVPLEDVAVSSIEDGLVLVPLKLAAGGADTADLRERLSTVVAELSRHFDLVLMDAAAHTLVSDERRPPSERGIADAVVLVQDARSVDHNTTGELTARLRNANVNTLGIVENFVRNEE